MNSIGNRIKTFRKIINLNQSEFAISIYITQGTLSDIENNKFNPSFNTIESIIKVYNICANWIFQGQCQYPNEYNNCIYYTRLIELQVVDKDTKAME